MPREPFDKEGTDHDTARYQRGLRDSQTAR